MGEVEFQSKQSDFRVQVLDCYVPLLLWYVWIICWHSKIKRGNIKIQIYRLSEWKISGSNNQEPHSKSQPHLDGDLFFDFPESPPFPHCLPTWSLTVICHLSSGCLCCFLKHSPLIYVTCWGPCRCLWP